jgi:hypothetical protein
VFDAQIKFKDKIQMSNNVMIAMDPFKVNKKRKENRMAKYRERMRRNVLCEFQIHDWKPKSTKVTSVTK